MKKALTIFFLSIYLFSATDLRELLKVNVLIEHFYETRKIDKSVTFCEYLVMHYVTDDSNNKDNDRDMQLPFRAEDKWLANASSVFLANQMLHFTFRPVGVKENDFLSTDDLFVFTNHHALVWRPPQLS